MQNTCSQDSKQNCFKFHMFHGHERHDDTMCHSIQSTMCTMYAHSTGADCFRIQCCGRQLLPNIPQLDEKI